MAANIIIEVRTWRNSAHNNTTGAGYGIRIPSSKYNCLKNWNILNIASTGDIVHRDKRAFNKRCPEIRSKMIGDYLIKNKLNNWQKGKPHKLKLEDLGQNEFKLYI